MNGKVVCNTGPLLALLITDQVDVLRHIFKEVIIPETVHDEILDGGAINSGLSNYRAITWINVMSLSNPPDPLLMTSLDAGEAAVIRLAMELKADFTLIDERKARKLKDQKAEFIHFKADHKEASTIKRYISLNWGSF